MSAPEQTKPNCRLRLNWAAARLSSRTITSPATMSTLSSVVSNLVRAQMGASVSNSVADDDLDRHVAELILKEAKQKLEKYNKDGIRAYLPQQCVQLSKYLILAGLNI